MSKPDTTDLRKRLLGLVAHRAGSGDDVPTAARRAYEDLAVVFVPLVSQAGFEALVARAFQLAQREYPAEDPPGGNGTDLELFVQIGRWLERQNQDDTIAATATMFAAVAALLTTLIGESLTTRYLQKAWPDGFSDEPSKGKQA